MIKIEYILPKQNLFDYPLEDFDHIWLFDNFKKTSSALLNPRIKNILDYYMPASYIIKRTKNGRPYAQSTLGPLVSFSLSHRADKAVLLISKEDPCGIDLEHIKDSPYINKIAMRYFGARLNLSLIEFYQAWTAREAFIKTMDLRLFEYLAQIEFKKESLLISLVGSTPDYYINYALYQEHFLLGICRSIKNERPLLFFSDG